MNKWREALRPIVNIRFVIVAFVFMSLIFLDKPGLYMDAVNPDYMGLHVFNSDNVSVWAYSDNIIASLIEGNTQYSHFPMLNSLYGTCFEMYTTMIWSVLFGYSVYAIRTLHILYSVIVLLALYKLLKYILEDEKKATIITAFFAIEPSFLFSSRTQYYIQLFPHVFFLFGLLLIVKAIEDSEKNRNIVLGAILLGLSASSYFVFAFYFAGISISYLIILIKKKRCWIKNECKLIGGFLIGYAPYIYAHLSIIMTQGVDGWINALKGLDTYGISNGANTSIIERVLHIVQSLENIAGGNSIIQIMTGYTIGTTYGKIVALLYIVLAAVAIVLIIKNWERLEESKEILVLFFLVSILFSHIILALLVGNALGYQHFVMLLPIMYLTGSLVIVREVDSRKMINKSTFTLEIVLFTIAFAFISLERIYEGYNIVNKTGGIGYYSETINELSYFLDGVVTDNDTIISPQWGYWMQIACITDGKKRIWNNQDQESLQWRIENNNMEGKYYIILDNNTDIDMVNNLMYINGYVLEKKEQFNDCGSVLSPSINIYCKGDN